METAEELIEAVRDQIDEVNTATIQDARILRDLSRAQQELVRLLARRYNPQFMDEVIFKGSDFKPAIGSTIRRVVELPSLAFGYMINQVEARLGNAWLPLSQTSFRHTLALDVDVSSSVPLSYSIMGNKMYLYPSPSRDVEVRVRFQLRPPKLTRTLGRITGLDFDTNEITLNSLDSEITTNVDELKAFLHIVDPIQGIIKGAVQISGIDEEESTLTVKTEDLARETVFGRSVLPTIPEDAQTDDLVCFASGSCVPYLANDLSNYLIELASFTIKRSLGLIDSPDFSEKDRIEREIGKWWSGREYTMQIQRSKYRMGYSYQQFFRGK